MRKTRKKSKTKLWLSCGMKGLVVLFMLFDSVTKFIQPPEVMESTLALGFQEHHLLILGSLGLISTLLYIFPITSVLGAVLLTGYFGGVIATHIRLDNPLFSHVLFPVYLAILAWGGLWLKEQRLRELLPLRQVENS